MVCPFLPLCDIKIEIIYLTCKDKKPFMSFVKIQCKIYIMITCYSCIIAVSSFRAINRSIIIILSKKGLKSCSKILYNKIYGKLDTWKYERIAKTKRFWFITNWRAYQYDTQNGCLLFVYYKTFCVNSLALLNNKVFNAKVFEHVTRKVFR